MTDTLKIEAGGEYLLRNGWRMRCYATDGGGNFPVHGAAYQRGSHDWLQFSWTPSGALAHGQINDEDIISEAPKPIEVDCWLWVYGLGGVVMHSKPYAGGDISNCPLAQFHIKRTILPGEGM